MAGDIAAVVVLCRFVVPLLCFVGELDIQHAVVLADFEVTVSAVREKRDPGGQQCGAEKDRP